LRDSDAVRQLIIARVRRLLKRSSGPRRFILSFVSNSLRCRNGCGAVRRPLIALQTNPARGLGTRVEVPEQWFRGLKK